MAQSSRILDDVGRLMNSAAGVADGVRREIETELRALKAEVATLKGKPDAAPKP